MTHENCNNKCKHEVAYCEKCDTIYCKKCGREWKDERVGIPYYPVYPPTDYPHWLKPFDGPFYVGDPLPVPSTIITCGGHT